MMQVQNDPMFVAYKLVQTSDFSTACGKSRWLTLGMHTLIDGVFINSYKLMPYFIDKETG